LTAYRMSRSRCSRAAAAGTGSGSVSTVVVTSAEHAGKGRFHWFDRCLGHYWDTAAIWH